MPRRTAEQRHRETAPASQTWPPSGADLVDTLIAIHHPTRRNLYEALTLDGPAKVGTLAAGSGLAVGSVSHHLGILHRSGFVVPAPELAGDTRESWWRAVSRRIAWSADLFASGSAGRQVAQTAEEANFRWQTRARAQWMQDRDALPLPWRTLGTTSDAVVNATAAQLDDLATRMSELVTAWSDDCRLDRDEHPDAVRRPVRAVASCFPSAPVRP